MTNEELLRRELEIFRKQRRSAKPHKRPTFSPEQRWAILQLMRLRGWSVQTTADRFVLHPNTIRLWLKAVHSESPGRLLGGVPWNRIDDAVRHAVHELRALFSEPEFGRRSIAFHLIRAGIQISPRTAQRVLREQKPRRPRRRVTLRTAIGANPQAILNPAHLNQTWHLDLTTVQVLWLRYSVTAVLDGCTRGLLRLKVFRGAPNTEDMIRLVGEAVTKHGPPGFLVTDHGCQFQKAFHAAVIALGIRHVRAPVRKPCFNGKVERFFRTFRLWLRTALLPIGIAGMQRRLDDFCNWYNHQRPHQALGGLTPGEAWAGEALPGPISFRTVDPYKPTITVERVPCRGDPRLAVVRIRVAA